ncbi:MAG: hypothetical protein ACOC2W_02800 [bacterium]
MINLINNEIHKLINEGITDIVYHFTYIPNLINILKTNKFMLTPVMGGESDENDYTKGRYFFLSTQRSKGMSGYGALNGNVCIVLDGRKLSHNYKSIPIDFWSDTIHKSDEMEDRIVSDKPQIDNAKKYIIEIHVLGTDHSNDEINAIEGNSNDIIVYYYDNEKDYRLLNKNNAIQGNKLKPNDNKNDGVRKRNEFYHLFLEIAPIILIDGNKRKEIFNLLKEYLDSIGSSEAFTEITHKIYDKVDEIKNKSYSEIYINGIYQSVKATVHNNRGNSNPYYRELLKILVSDMKKHKTQKLDDYIKGKL